MGMYDYLGEYQVKLFYIPLFYKPFSEDGGYSLTHSGGSLRSFGKGDQLPLETGYYKYCKDFCIFDNNCEDYGECGLGVFRDLVHIIKDGMYLKTVVLDDFDEKDIGDAVYTYYGRMLNINNKKDFYEHLKILKELEIKDKEIQNKYYPNGVMNTIRDNMDFYLKNKDSYFGETKELKNIYFPKLYKEDLFYLEKLCGEYIDVLLYAFEDMDKPKDVCRDYKKYFKEVLEETTNFISQNEGILDKYFEYFKEKTTPEHKDVILKVLSLIIE